MGTLTESEIKSAVNAAYGLSDGEKQIAAGIITKDNGDWPTVRKNLDTAVREKLFESPYGITSLKQKLPNE